MKRKDLNESRDSNLPHDRQAKVTLYIPSYEDYGKLSLWLADHKIPVGISMRDIFSDLRAEMTPAERGQFHDEMRSAFPSDDKPLGNLQSKEDFEQHLEDILDHTVELIKAETTKYLLARVEIQKKMLADLKAKFKT